VNADFAPEVAVARNAESRESFCNVRIARDETRKVMPRLFPGITFNCTRSAAAPRNAGRCNGCSS
jgi:hypothetical protein